MATTHGHSPGSVTLPPTIRLIALKWSPQVLIGLDAAGFGVVVILVVGTWSGGQQTPIHLNTNKNASELLQEIPALYLTCRRLDKQTLEMYQPSLGMVF